MILKNRLWEIWGRINVPGVINFTPFQCGQIAIIESLIEECVEDWMPIADAPKDRRITLWYPKPKNKCIGQWDNEVGDWWIDNYGYSTLHQPTLWRELPEDPK